MILYYVYTYKIISDKIFFSSQKYLRNMFEIIESKIFFAKIILVMKTTCQCLLLDTFTIILHFLYYMHYLYIRVFLLRIAPSTLFHWTKEKLPCSLTEGLPCPKCSKIWNIDDLIEKCKMSPDERLFFKSVETIIKRNAELVK